MSCPRVDRLGIDFSFTIESIDGTRIQGEGRSLKFNQLGFRRIAPVVGDTAFIFNNGLLGIANIKQITEERTAPIERRFYLAHQRARKSAINSVFWMRVVSISDMFHWITAYRVSTVAA